MKLVKLLMVSRAWTFMGTGRVGISLLLDQRMAGMDGLEVLRRLNPRDAVAQMIMITAYASVELAVEAMKIGATDFVRKPMTPEILRGAVAAAISKSTQRRAEASTRVETDEPRPQIETITLNGFEIIRPTPADAVRTQPDERAFIVKTPDGKRAPVVVKIDDEAVSYVERITLRKLPAHNSFWTYAAERLLSDYLWDEGKIPPGGKLSLREIDREQLITAERWDKPAEQA